jgi:predicted enzyme related to lactoylglutathione lyase
MIRDLAFVQLTVADWPRALAWYRDVLGLEVLLCREAERFALLRAGSGKLALKEGQPVAGTCLLTFETADLTATAGVLTARGVALSAPKPSAEGYRRILLHDPDGHALCLFEWAVAPASEN